MTEIRLLLILAQVFFPPVLLYWTWQGTAADLYSTHSAFFAVAILWSHQPRILLTADITGTGWASWHTSAHVEAEIKFNCQETLWTELYLKKTTTTWKFAFFHFLVYFEANARMAVMQCFKAKWVVIKFNSYHKTIKIRCPVASFTILVSEG